MRANELNREDVAAFVESERGRGFLATLDELHWTEATEVARRYGFVVSAYGGVAVLSTYESMLEEVGTEGVVRMLQMSGVEIPMDATA